MALNVVVSQSSSPPERPRSQASPLCSLSARRSWTTSQVKEAVKSESGIPVQQQRLYDISLRQELKSEQSLGSFSGEDSLSLRLVPRTPEQSLWFDRVQERSTALSTATPRVRKDRDVLLAAVECNGRALQYATEDMRSDREVVLAAVRQDGYALRFAAPPLRNDYEVVEEAIKQNGLALSFAAADMQKERRIVDMAVTQNSSAIGFAHDTLRSSSKYRQQAASTLSYSGKPQSRGRIANTMASRDGRWPSLHGFDAGLPLSTPRRQKKSSADKKMERKTKPRAAIFGGFICLADLGL